ncbi:MAG: hypothetical protein KKB50_12730 [Planctomycetes bacterium]|nr:hypothetical protein [Planctomycetota bacterium]
MTKTRKKLLALVAACAAGTVFQVGILPSGCSDYYVNMALNSFDFCSVFNCSGGDYFNFCYPVRLLADCP